MRPRASWHPYAMLAPTVLLLGTFFVYPVLLAGYYSLFSWDLLTPPSWVGAGNYAALLRTGELLRAASNTFAYSAVVVAGSMTLGLLLALAVDRPGRLAALVRGAVFSAYVVSWVAVALLFLWLLDGEGLISRAVRAVGLPSKSWLADPKTALLSLAFVAVWKGTGYAMVLFVAGLQDVPRSLHEAAALDGAGAFGRFRHVTWPLLRPTAAFVATTSLIASFQAFDLVRIMTQGGPANATQVFVYAIYEQVFSNLRVGRASAEVVIFAAVVLALSALQLRLFRSPERGAS